MTAIEPEGVGFFLATKIPGHPALWCKSCDRSIRVVNDQPGAVEELKAQHRCGPTNGRWS